VNPFTDWSGGCPYSPKPDLRKKRNFATDCLRDQRPIHTPGQQRKLTVTFDLSPIGGNSSD